MWCWRRSSQGQNHDIRREERAWKAFLLLPRLLLHRRCRGGKIGKEKLTERFQNFWAGRWDGLLAASIAHDEEASLLASRKRRTQNHNDLEHRVNRAMTRIQSRPKDPLPPEIAHFEPASLFSLDKDKFAANLRSSRRGTAGGPSGMTNEHLRPLLDNPRELHLFFRVAELLARGQVPECCIRLEEGEDDSLAEAGRWGQRHCSRRCCSTFGRKNDFATVGEGCRECYSAVPVRTVHQSRMRVRGARGTGDDRFGP